MKNFTSLLLVICACFSAHSYGQTIPNGGFESWTNMGSYSDPDNWVTSNSFVANTVQRGTPGAAGSAYIRIHNDSLAGIGKCAGFAMTGQAMFGFGPAFPVATQVACLEGKYQCHITGHDSAAIGIQLTNSSTGTPAEVGSNGLLLTNTTITTWTAFSIPIIYTGTPDSAMIFIAASLNQDSMVMGNYIYIDDLHFCAPAAVETAIVSPAAIVAYPNPANDEVHVYGAPDGASVRIVNNVGQIVHAQPLVSSVNVADLIPGIYLISVIGDRGEVVKTMTFVKQ